MIYLDNAATTCPKPHAVTNAMVNAVLYNCANPGRSGHDMSIKAGELVYSAREKASELFGLSNAQGVVFTKNCTESLNIALQGLLQNGDHVVTSTLEHNSVIRVLESLKTAGKISYDMASVYADTLSTVSSFESHIRRDTKMLVCTLASNVFGTVLPIAQLSQLAQNYGLIFVLDASQGAMTIDMRKLNIDVLCLPGHKGLYGPMGTGLMLVNSTVKPMPLMYGGTGSYSQDRAQPKECPDAYESGTLNVPGIAGLCAGIDFVKKTGVDNIAAHERRLVSYAEHELKKFSGVKTYASECPEKTVLSFNVGAMHSEQVAALLNENGIAVRAGYHCAYTAHSFYGTERTGTIRMSPGVFSTPSDIEILLKNVYKIAKGSK